MPLYESVFAPLASPYNASLLYALTYVALMFALALWMYRQKRFVRV
jgi:predicted acyltransferase